MKDHDDITIHNYNLPSKILFKVVDVKLLACLKSDEVYAEFLLLPDSEEGEVSAVKSVPKRIPSKSFQKVLTASDTSTHGGCFLPKFFVERTFPPLDVSQDQASQRLVVKDIHGAQWDLRHVYRGNPKRHMLVDGWNKFASAKKLRAGDACIFMRGLDENEVYIGIQRAVSMQNISTDLTGSDMRRGVLADVSLSMDERTNFHVLYHPRMCASAFIVPYEIVMKALKVNYSPGMHFETRDFGGEDPEHMSKKFTGIITAKEDIDPARWPNSEWRCLKVRWDVTPPRHLFTPRVSPWDIQPLAYDVPHMLPSIPVDRKRSMPFDPVMRDIPLSRNNENNHSGGLQNLALTLSIGNTGSSSHHNETNDAEDMKVGESWFMIRTMVSKDAKGKEVYEGK